MTPILAAAIAAALVPALSLVAPSLPVPVADGATDLPPIAIAVAECESDNVLDAKNPNSSASGPYQFTDGTWTWVTGLEPPARAHPRHVQDQAFLDLWDDGAGAEHWDETRECWQDAA